MSKEKTFLHVIGKSIKLYIKHGPRSNKKTQYLHKSIKSIIKNALLKDTEKYSIKLEHDIPSFNSSGTKSCDIVLLSKKTPLIVFPVKFIMSNYNQNKNNYFENLTGECSHIKWINENLKIVPINIILNRVPYLSGDKIIKFEHIKYDSTFSIYKNLVEKNICSKVITFIIDVEHQNKEGQNYDKCPIIIGFNNQTPYVDIGEITKFVLNT